MGYINVLYGGCKNVIKRLMYFIKYTLNLIQTNWIIQ